MDCEYLITCDFCLREWDGNAQCPCTMYISDDDETHVKKSKTKEVSTQTKKVRVWSPTKLELAQEAVNTSFDFQNLKKKDDDKIKQNELRKRKISNQP